MNRPLLLIRRTLLPDTQASSDTYAYASIVPGNRVLSSGLRESYFAVFGETYRPETFAVHSDPAVAASLNDRLTKERLKGEHAASMHIAIKALVEYNKTVTGGGGYDADELLQLASIALPNCLQEDEANFLSVMGLMDCDIIGDGFSSGPKLCPGTCGFNFAGLFYSPMVAKIYFMLFISVSQFVLLQLVIAVLMDQLGAAQEEDAKEYNEKAPGCQHLSVAVFKRTLRRFRANARRKTLEQQGLRGDQEPGHPSHTTLPPLADKHGDGDADDYDIRDEVMRIRVVDSSCGPSETPCSEDSEAVDKFVIAPGRLPSIPLGQSKVANPCPLMSPVRRSLSLTDLRPLPRPISTEMEDVSDALTPGAAASPRRLQSVAPLPSPSPRILPHMPA